MARSVIFTAIIVVVSVFALLYAALAIPSVQNRIRSVAESELSLFLGSELTIESLSIRPLNEVIIEGVSLLDPEGEQCLSIDRLGAGINLWRLIVQHRVEITYVELLKFKADVSQEAPDAPLNIDFLIKAFAPKKPGSPPARFDLQIYNVVIRGGEITFSRLWKEQKRDGLFDPDHLLVSNFSGDITLPRLSNELIEIDLRRLSFAEASGLQVKEIGGYFTILPDSMKVSGFILRLPQSQLRLSDFTLPFSLFNSPSPEGRATMNLSGFITPSNLSPFLPLLADCQISFPLSATVDVSPEGVSVSDFSFGSPSALQLFLDANLAWEGSLPAPVLSRLHVSRLSLISNSFEGFLSGLNLRSDPKVPSSPLVKLLSPEGRMPVSAGALRLEAGGNYDFRARAFAARADLSAAAGSINTTVSGRLSPGGDLLADAGISVPSLALSSILESSPVEAVHDAVVDIHASVPKGDFRNASGSVGLSVGNIRLMGRDISAITGSGSKEGNLFNLSLDVSDGNLDGSLAATVTMAGEKSLWEVDAEIADFDTYSSLLADSREEGYELSGRIRARAVGNSVDNLSGTLDLRDFSLRKWNGRELAMRSLSLDVSNGEDDRKSIVMCSDFADFDMSGRFMLSRIPGMVRRTLFETLPALFPAYAGPSDCGWADFTVRFTDANPVIEFFDLPVIPLTEVTLSGGFDSASHHIRFDTDIPYIRQGAKNIISDTYLRLDMYGDAGAMALNAGTVYPTKKGLLKLDAEIEGERGMFDILLDFNRGRDVSFHGDIDLAVTLDRDPLSGELLVKAEFNPTSLFLNEAEWKVGEAEILYTEGLLDVRGFSIRHADQFVLIEGRNSQAEGGILKVSLADIDMDYVFGTLNINHVTFGGTVTGDVTARDIFSPAPEVMTQRLVAHDFTYNGAFLGDVADLHARLSLPEKMIAIGAKISENGRRVATAEGGVWFGRDSLAFDFDADRVNVGFIQPFMEAFSSDVKGRATGRALLYGTFSDIDMTGKIYADSLDILIDYINARYSGSDTVWLYPGRIDIPGFRVYDKKGHAAMVSGELTHRYFHDPSFRFRITDMDRLLVYDTNEKMNDLWYGTIYASGNGEIVGRPGLVRIAADVETEPGSDFTFVLSDRQEAVKSHFLTFSDRRREAAEQAERSSAPGSEAASPPPAEKNGEGTPDIFQMDFRVSVTDAIRFNLIMDPAAGDKIVAYGDGAMTLAYSSLTDALQLYGKYTLEKGTYNFSLQDIILKEFIIKPGSSISFTGDPYTGVLDITAAYRVNTSLTELDKSFATDRELNRTSVPVEALLKVKGLLTHPDIGFDIDLPTVTQETAQKVRSIISTDDMMSRQVLFLVALNKFYPPEYMQTSFTGGEWASVASSTISSQVQNMIGQLTDKFTLSPSIRSDKGDFSDIEVDLSLTSRLFHNRLLINGNVGYRDPSNSSTTFVGDFDLEYLLNKKGNWRLKAYNHFNDQNYYLKSALTTQGIGLIWRTDFK